MTDVLEGEVVEKLPLGRPSSYTEESANLVCALLSQGHSLRKICESAKHYKDGNISLVHTDFIDQDIDWDQIRNITTYFYWMRSNEDFSKQYARAKEESAESDFDRIEDVAAQVLENKIDFRAARVSIDALKWIAGKKKPKKYGEVHKSLGEEIGDILVNKCLSNDAAHKLEHKS